MTSASGGSSILGLPDAVLRQICMQFCPHCGGEDCLGSSELPDSFWGPEYFGTLGALAQVNVRVGRQAQAIRLHVFCGRRDSLPLLARSLVERPGLAAHISVVRLDDHDKDGGHGCILGELATPRNIGNLAALVAPVMGDNTDLSGASGNQHLLAPFKQLPAAEEPFFCAPGGGWMPAHTPEAMDGVANARLNAFIVFNLAKNIKSIAILSEWPLALFADSTQGHMTINIGPLPTVENLRLGGSSSSSSNNNNGHSGPQKRMINMRKTTGLLAHLQTLSSLEIRGGDNTLSAAQVLACNPMANLTALKLTATSLAAVDDILLCCRSGPLKHFHFSIPAGREAAHNPGNDIQGRQIIDRLVEYGFAATLKSLHIDTSASILFAADQEDIRRTFMTAHSLSDFRSLRHLSISADSIYYPSGHPRVLLRDPNTGNERLAQRLCAFLPGSVQSVEITGIYAIHKDDVLELARACFPMAKFVALKTVRLRGDVGDTLNDVYHDDDASGTDESDSDASDSDGWDSGSDWADGDMGDGPTVNEQVASLFAAAGVDYEFDTPEYYVDQCLGDLGMDPGA
ncbi:hypothetical protein C8A05DRAFT_33202 [Staphylotrichum tortipilum]|uniref:Uncharacterized protein n=1 Tax=Staphylotrichum tortipilum TaxID=2831512 RepID=A0AAN6RUC2_9PEZI|nr:hypothetical protein C8A05DRAFT_33202 [Staphylotrichum longicolle]